MRIALDISVLNNNQRSGIAVYTYNLIDALLKNNNNDHFVLFGIATFETFDYLKNLSLKNYPNVEMKIFKMPARFFRTSFLLWQKLNWPTIEKFIGVVDILHSFNWYMPPQINGKKVGTIFDLTSLTHPEWHQAKTTQLDKVRFARLANADLVITISESSRKDYSKLYPNARLEIVYPAVSSIFNGKIDKNLTRKILQKYIIKKDFFLSVATIEPRKNLSGLIKAYLKSKLQNQLILVGGAGWKNSEIKKFVQNQDRIKFAGFIPEEDLHVLYQQALCLIYPSLYEGFGLPILEAQACGCPVITSNLSSMPEVAGEGAMLVNPYSIEDIMKAMVKCQNPNTKLQMVRVGYENVKRFSWKKSAKKLNFLYEKLLED